MMSVQECSSSSAEAVSSGNAFVEAADPSMYRAADDIIARCTGHGSAVVLCTTAGKSGRNGRTATVGPTLFWLTCGNLNNLIARLERSGAVAQLTQYMRSRSSLERRHVESHKTYEAAVRRLLSPNRAQFFFEHFVDVPENVVVAKETTPVTAELGTGQQSSKGERAPDPACDASSSRRECSEDAAVDGPPLKKPRAAGVVYNSTRKYGNAAVGFPTELKCLHALAAQSLAGVSNPVGDYVLAYIQYLGSRATDVDPPSGASEEHDDTISNPSNAALRAYVDDCTNFITFVEYFELQRGRTAVADVNVTETYPSSLADFNAVRTSDLCGAAASVLLAAEGKPPTNKRKHRRN